MEGPAMRLGRLLTAGLTLGVVGSAVAASTAPGPDGWMASFATGAPAADAPSGPAAAPADALHNFYFVRARYTDSGMYPHWKDWKTDFTKADVQFLTVFLRIAVVDVSEEGMPIR